MIDCHVIVHFRSSDFVDGRCSLLRGCMNKTCIFRNDSRQSKWLVENKEPAFTQSADVEVLVRKWHTTPTEQLPAAAEDGEVLHVALPGTIEFLVRK